jgi:hypothetical protein
MPIEIWRGSLMRMVMSLVMSALVLTSCVSDGAAPRNGQKTQVPPTEPISLRVEFPDGAPPFNETATFICIVITRSMAAKDVSVTVKLPRAFELVSGNLTWQGNLPQGNETPVINAVIKSVETGDWTIDVRGYIDPEKHGLFGGNLYYPVYVRVTDKTAEWRLNPPYGIPSGGGSVAPEDHLPTPPATATASANGVGSRAAQVDR